MDSSMTDLVEHRLNELQKMVEENRKDISEIKDAMVRMSIDLARVEENMKHTATKAWVLGGVLGGMAIAATIAGTILKYWPGRPFLH